MTKQTLIEKMSLQTGLTKKDTEATLQAFQDVVMDSLVDGEKVQLVGWGTFEVAERAARVGRNPKTDEEIQIPAKKVAKFKAGSKLKEAVNK